MHLPYNKSFQKLKIVGLAMDRCHVVKEDLVRLYFQLSEPPPLGWAYIFTTVWRSLSYPAKRQTGVEQDSIWIDCIPEEVGTFHLAQLEHAVEQTCAIYRQQAQEQAQNEVRQAQSHAEFHSRLNHLNQVLYPETASSSQGDSIITKCLRLYVVAGEENVHCLLQEIQLSNQ